MNYFPVAVQLNSKKVIVVGGGSVAQRKVLSLLEAGARVQVIAPQVTNVLKKLAKEKRIQWAPCSVRRQDLANAKLIVAATDKRHVNEKVSQWARLEGIMVNVVDEPSLCDFISPAIVRQDKALIAVYTDGKDPVFFTRFKKLFTGAMG